MAIDGTQLRVRVVEGERWRRTLTVTVPAGVVESERLRLRKKLAARLRLPGFRKGRVPAAVVERRYRAVLDRETIDELVDAAYREALSRNGLKPISEGELGDLHYEPQQDLTFSISFDVRPEIELSRVGGFRIERPAVGDLDDRVQDVLGRLRAQNGTWAPLEGGRPEDGNRVSVEIERLEDGAARGMQPYEFVLGTGDAIPDIEQAIKSLEVGTLGDFVVRFPDDFANEERRGDEEHLRIRLNSRQVLELPELSEDFARSLGDFEGLADLSEKVRTDLRREAEDQAESVVRGRLLDAILDANPFRAPVSMVDRYVESLLGSREGVPDEKWQEASEQVAPQAELAVKRMLVLERVSESQGFRATKKEVDARIEEIAEKSGEARAKVTAGLKKNDRLGALEREITERKVFEFLKKQSEITEN